MPRKYKDLNWKILRQDWKKMNMSNGMCVVCENGYRKFITSTDWLQTCIWYRDAVERLIKSCISNSFQISPFIILTGHFQQSVESKLENMILSITRWTLWKFRNNKKYEGNAMNVIAKYRMLFKRVEITYPFIAKAAKIKNFRWCPSLYQFKLKWLCLQMRTWCWCGCLGHGWRVIASHSILWDGIA